MAESDKSCGCHGNGQKKGGGCCSSQSQDQTIKDKDIKEIHNESGELQLFAKQEKIYPKRITGLYRNLKWAAMIICLAIYYMTPFLRWDRGDNAPNQAVMIDIEKGRAYWFWVEIWPQEVYILTGILILAAICLFFVTALFGRVWCGYFCFQTVWTDLFVWVERVVQGDRGKRKKLQEGKWSFEKIYKLAITHTLWILISLVTAGSFVLYFNDAPTLIRDVFAGNISTTVMGFVGGLTFSTYLMAGFAREQVCTFMCPYARFQSAMFDKDTLIIGYDVERGEPRGKYKKGDSWDNRGDCINCSACVQVCPMGIDIRDGLQMQCIACGLCIDACDEIMEKVDRPKGLVRYDTERHMEDLSKHQDTKFRILRPRTFYYIFVLLMVGGLMVTALATRSEIGVTALHDRNPLFVRLSNGDIRNGYVIKILNKTHNDKVYNLQLSGLDNYEIVVKSAGSLTADSLPVVADSVGSYQIFVSSQIKPQAQKDIQFTLTDVETGLTDTYESVFVTKR